MEAGSQRRRNPRAPVSLSVKYDLAGKKHSARALNLSATGMLIETKTPARLAERLKVAFKIPEEKEEIAVEAEVVWVNRYSPDYPLGMALKFAQLEGSTKKAIDNYVGKVLEGSGQKVHREALVSIPD